MPRATASARVAAPSLPRMAATWNLAVWSEILRRAAISLLARPAASICRTRARGGLAARGVRRGAATLATRLGRRREFRRDAGRRDRRPRLAGQRRADWWRFRWEAPRGSRLAVHARTLRERQPR